LPDRVRARVASRLAQAEYRIVPDAGHSAWEPGILGALVEATQRFKSASSFAA